jgi:hypothetical protein
MDLLDMFCGFSTTHNLALTSAFDTISQHEFLRTLASLEVPPLLSSVKLCGVDVIPESHYNLMSITKLMEEGHKMTANSKEGITLEQNGRVIKFDMRVETPKGVLWCAYIKRNDSDGEVAAGSSDNRLDTKPVEKSEKVLEPVLKMHIRRAQAILGQASKDATQKMAVVLNMLTTCGGLKHVNHA